jgi:hypothetical protein
MFGFYSTQKGVQNLLEMNLQIYFIKEKEILYFFLLPPWFGPLAQPARALRHCRVGPRRQPSLSFRREGRKLSFHAAAAIHEIAP